MERCALYRGLADAQLPDPAQQIESRLSAAGALRRTS
jgi:hypothetical protein